MTKSKFHKMVYVHRHTFLERQVFGRRCFTHLNLFPLPGEWRSDQTRIRIDRKSQTAAPGAIVTGERVKPGSVFSGELLIFQERQGAAFGRCRTIGGVEVDVWLKYWTEPDDAKRQLFLLNEVLIPALINSIFWEARKVLEAVK